ncbi:MAG: DHHA1 domain-containing protein [Candidatus Thermoplasmatota archaeon]
MDFESEVKKVRDDEIILEETYFHPEEGGQPPDRGTLGGYEVKDVQKKGQEIVHHLVDHDLEVGDVVEGKIDEVFRYTCMRGHTGAHVVYGAGREVMGKVSYAGFDIGEKKARIDFETETHIDKKKLLRLEELCNEVILENRSVKWKILDKEEVESSDEIAFAKEIPEGEKVRIIEVEDWDRGVCSGTHLDNTLEVGRIRVEGKKKLQEGVTRITFSFGEEALKRDYREERAVLRAVEALDTNKKDLPKKIRRLQDKLKDMEEKIEQLESEKIEQELEEFEKFERENFELLVQTLSTEDTETLSHKAKDEVGEDEAMVIINEREKLSVVVGVGKDVEEINANDLIQTISKKFGGGGGGTSDFAQGGGFDTTAGDLKDFLIKFTE